MPTLHVAVDAGQGAIGTDLEFPITLQQFHRTLRETDKEANRMAEEYAYEDAENADG